MAPARRFGGTGAPGGTAVEDGPVDESAPPGDQVGAEVLHLRRRRRDPDPSSGPISLEDAMAEMGERTALQALAGAYADRLALVRAGADAEELLASAALIATLERSCLRNR